MILGLFHSGFGLLYRRDDVGIRGTPANVATHVFADLSIAGGVLLAHAGYRRKDLTRRAVAALKRVVLKEGRLHGMQGPVGLCHPFDRGHALAYTRRKREAGEHTFVPEKHRARAALTVIAAFLGACQAEAFTQQIEQRRARIEGRIVNMIVDR